MIAVVGLLLAASVLPPAAAASLTEQLKTNIGRTDRAIIITEQEAARARVQPYAPELQFRLAELFIEKSRYLYMLHQQDAGVGNGSQVAPEVRLIKQKAIDIYERLLRDAPDWSGDDRVRFYLAHELRELGQFDRMLKLEEELADKHPDSPLAAEAMLIVGDHWFNAKDLARAETAYQRILNGPASPAQDLARFKMGWVRLNQGKHSEAVTYFEATASSPVSDRSSADVLNVKREALFDLVFSYTESRPSKGAVEYFEKLAGSHAVFVGVLEKLANRYFIKQEWEAAVAAYRRLLALSHNPERDPEFAGRLYQSLKSANANATAMDVWNIVRAAARVRTNEKLTEGSRKTTLDELEVYARDLATLSLVSARKTAGIDAANVGKPVANKADFSEAADAHEAWLSLFRASPQSAAMERNRADALFLAERWHEAGQAFEAAAEHTASASDREEALYNALAAYARAVPQVRDASSAPLLSGAWRIADARRAMALVGARYVSTFPRSSRVAQVKFNVARAAYDGGDWKRATELFAAFVREHPSAADAGAAANLALDAAHIAGDYDTLDKVGSELVANEAVPAAIRKEVAGILARAQGERLSAVALQSTAASGDAAQGLVELAASKGGTTLGEQALFAAFATYRERKDLAKATETGQRFVASYPGSPKVVDVEATLAKAAMELADYDAAATAYALIYERFPKESASLDALRTAATLAGLLGDPRRALTLLEQVPTTRRDGALWRQLAELRLAAGDPAGAEQAARSVLATNAGDADAGVLLTRALLERHKAADALSAAQDVLAAAKKGASSESAIARLWGASGEAALRVLLALPPDPLEPQVAALKDIQQATTNTAQLGATAESVEGIYRLAVGFDRLTNSLASIGAPEKLSPEDGKKFLAAVAAQASGMKAQAQQAFDTCVAKAKELDVVAPFVTACTTRTMLAETQFAGPTPTSASSVATIVAARGQLRWGTPDAAAVEGLGLAQLGTGDLRRARLTFQRVLEIDRTRASAQAALGVALVRLGESAAAHASYRAALELDAKNARARAGEAALLCRFGRVEDGRAELKRLASAPDPAPGDIDPDIAKCGAGR